MKRYKRNNLLLFIAISILSFGCVSDEESKQSPRMPEINFEPEEGEFSGKPGDTVDIFIRVDGESGFNSLTLQKMEGENLLDEETLAENEEVQFEVPYEFVFPYTLKEEEMDKDIRLFLIVERVSHLPSGGGTVFNSSRKEFKIQTLPSD